MGRILHAKPRFIGSCTQCGVCCENQLCDMVVKVLGISNAPCPALERTETGPANCGMISRPAWYMFKLDNMPAEETKWLSDRLKSMRGFGSGCRDESRPVIFFPFQK